MDPAAKQQVVERIKQADNILVTISKDPSVDQLAACIAFTLMLNKMGKHGTAIFSGKIPSTIEFLQPEKTIEKNTDSLQDFIISLDKSKADKLRYKVEDEVVRVFITPYRTSLSEKDLIFSHGDFNIDAVIALGVEDRAHIDTVVASHGRILHDATVITINTKESKGRDLGQINWQDPSASSLSEMLVSLSEALGTGLIDNQIATAFLTGIVAETERFSNAKTSPKVMTMSAQLMAAGANQQLVISKLEPPPPPTPPPPPPAPIPPKPKAPEKPKEPPKPKAPEKPKEEKKIAPAPKEKGELSVAHDLSEFDGSEVEINSTEIHIDQQGNIETIEEGRSKPGAPAKGAEPSKSSKPPLASTQTPPKEKEPAPEVAPKIEVEAPPQKTSPPPPPSQPTAEAHKEPTKTPEPLPSLPPVPLPPVTSSIPPNPPAPQSPPATDQQPVLPPPPPPPPVQYSQEDKPSPHTVMDPFSQRPPAFGTSFSAGTEQQGWSGSNLPVDPINVDPANAATGGDDGFAGEKVIPVPPHTQTPLDQLLARENPAVTSSNMPPATPNGTGVDSARSAVENAYAAVPYNPDLNPVVGLGSQPMGPDLHPPPTSADSTAQSNGTPPPSQPPMQQPPPPPMPPPIPPMPPPSL